MFCFLKPCFAAHCAFETVVPLVGGWNRHCLCLPVPCVYCSLVLLCKCKCVCLTAGLLSSRHIHRSAAHSPGAHPEAVWVSERARVGACCVHLCFSVGHHWGAISLTNMAPRKYMSVSVSTRNSASQPLAYRSFVAL